MIPCRLSGCTIKSPADVLELVTELLVVLELVAELLVMLELVVLVPQPMVPRNRDETNKNGL